jgi:hypothetical protein
MLTLTILAVATSCAQPTPPPRSDLQPAGVPGAVELCPLYSDITRPPGFAPSTSEPFVARGASAAWLCTYPPARPRADGSTSDRTPAAPIAAARPDAIVNLLNDLPAAPPEVQCLAYGGEDYVYVLQYPAGVDVVVELSPSCGLARSHDQRRTITALRPLLGQSRS